MKIKKIISLCKANKHISLYDMTTQMLGDGLAAYYLNDCPVFFNRLAYDIFQYHTDTGGQNRAAVHRRAAGSVFEDGQRRI